MYVVDDNSSCIVPRYSNKRLIVAKKHLFRLMQNTITTCYGSGEVSILILQNN